MVTFAYCETLSKMGHTTYYIAPQNSNALHYPQLNTILSPGLKIPTEQWRVGLPALGFKYRKSLKKIPFDIVHAQDPFIAGFEAAKIAKRLNVPLVSTFHSKYYDDFLHHTHSKKISKLLLKNIIEFYNKCDAVWAVNANTADVLREYGFRKDIRVMENGTNVEKLNSVAVKKMELKAGYDSNSLKLLFVGRHNKQKNIEGIIRACKILKDKTIPFKLVTAGDGPDFDRLVKLTNKLDLSENVNFLRHIDDRTELMALYSLADLVVFPSLYDNAPMVLREAASTGTAALLVAGSTSAENLKDGKNALIAHNETPSAIASRIIDGIGTFTEIGLEAKATIPISWEKIMQKVVVEYERLIEEKKSAFSQSISV